MNIATITWATTALLCAMAGPALSQPPAAAPASTDAPPPAPAARPARGAAQSEAGEPRADTSAAVPPAPASSTGRAAPAARAASEAKPGQKSAPKIDRLDLGIATVTGDREQPKVMYIVPWKRSDIGDLAGKPMNSLVDEILAPVDRDVFKREVLYYHAVQADASQNGAPPKPAPQGEK